MRPASAYIDRKRVPNEITHDEMKVEKDRPKTATPMRRRREIRRKEAEETERRSKPSFGGVEDEPKLLSSNQLTRLLRSPKGTVNYNSFRANNNINKSRPRTAPAKGNSNYNKRRSYRRTHVHVDPLRPHHASHHKANLTPIQRAQRYVTSAQRRKMLKPFPEPKSPEPKSVQSEKIIDLQRKIQELSIHLLRSEKKNKEYEKLCTTQSLELSRLSGYRSSKIRYHGLDGAAEYEKQIHDEKLNQKQQSMALEQQQMLLEEQRKLLQDQEQQLQLQVEAQEKNIGNFSSPPNSPIGGITGGGSQLLESSSIIEEVTEEEKKENQDGKAIVVEGNGSQIIEHEMNFSIIDEDSSYYNQHHDTGRTFHQPGEGGSSVVFPPSHPLHPRNRNATVKRLKRLAEENRKMRMLNKTLDSDLLSAQKQIRILQTKLASELKINRSIREATHAIIEKK